MRFAHICCALAVATVVAGERAQVPLSSGDDAPLRRPLANTSKVLDGPLVERITRLLEENHVPGYSLAVVRPGASNDVEYFTWGNRTEDGEPVTPEVRFAHIRFCTLADAGS
jgi:hypothetical protein